MNQFQPQPMGQTYGQTFGQPMPRKRKPWLLFGCLGCLGVSVVVVVVLIGALMWIGSRPTTSVQTGASMPAEDRQAIVDSGLVGAGESIGQIYTQGLADFRSDTFFFTENRVVQFGDLGDPGTHVSGTFDRVVDIRLIESGSFIEDSTIVVTLDDGTEIIGMVNNLNEEDRRFYNALRSAWRAANGEPNERPNEAPNEAPDEGP